MLQGRHNGKFPEWELRFNPPGLPVVTTKREYGDYSDEVNSQDVEISIIRRARATSSESKSMIVRELMPQEV